MASGGNYIPENENFCRYFRLVNGTGPKVLRKVLHVECAKNSVQLQVFLNNNITKIDNLKQKNIIRSAQYDLIFPADPSSFSLEKWDVSLLCVIVINLCTSNLLQVAKKAVECIRSARNDINHDPNPALDRHSFENKWGDLKQSIEDLLRYCQDSYFEANILDEIKHIKESPLDIAPVLELFYAFAKDRGDTEEAIRDFQTKMNELSEQLQKISTGIEQLKETSSHTDRTELSVVEVLQKDLMTFYKNNITAIPLSFLVEENVVSLLELYVKPPMSAVDVQQWRCPEESPDKISVNNYKEMLFQSDQTAFRNVYVTAEAGVGKTSLCNHIGLTWYHSHDGTLSQSFLSEDVNAMKLFDFCFLISLREVSLDVCNVDDFIYEFLEENLPGRPNLRDCMNAILDLATCSKLIVLDGLDEWIHPVRCRKLTPIPHAKCWNNCTIITTTRPWKFDEIQLPSSKIDRHIEISQLDEFSLSHLAQNAIKLLNDRSKSRKTMSVEDFNDEVEGVLKFGDFRSIPYIHLQTVCLWYDDLEIGNSKFEICSNIVKLILKRGLEKLKRLEIHDLDPTIKCLDHILQNKVQQIAQISDFLKSLSKLAFYTLFVEALPTMVTFDIDKALEHIDLVIDFELYLKLGLLSQKKSLTYVSRRESSISFPHKTLQEYFAAMYIYNNSDRDNTYTMIRDKCTSIQSILEMCNVFTFLSGFNPRLYTGTISNIVSGPPTESSDMASVEVDCFLSSDEVVKRFRNGSCLYFMHDRSTYNVMFAFQTMQLDCLHEIQERGQYDCFPCIEDIIINTTSKTEEYLSRIQHLIMSNQSNIKTLSVQEVRSTECTKIWRKLNIRSLQSLEMLQLWAEVSEDDLESILSQNVKTLKSVDISNVQSEGNKNIPKNKLLSRSCINAITNMPHLKIIHLEQVSLNHGYLKDMVNFVSCHKKMTHIGMMYIKCATHRNRNCNGVDMDLSGHEHLLGLCLHEVFVLRKLYVTAQLLEVFMIGKLPTDIAWHCLRKIPQKPVIHTLSCRNLDHTVLSEILKVTQRCLKLQKLYFFNTPSPIEIYLDLSSDLKNLEFVDLHRLEITCLAISRLVDSVSSMTQTVNITLDGCTVLPENEFTDLKMKIKKNARFRVQFDGKNQKKRVEFRFQKVDISSQLLVC